MPLAAIQALHVETGRVMRVHVLQVLVEGKSYDGKLCPAARSDFGSYGSKRWHLRSASKNS